MESGGGDGMLLIKPESDGEFNPYDLPPSYDALSLHHSISCRHAGPSVSRGAYTVADDPVPGSSSVPPWDINGSSSSSPVEPPASFTKDKISVLAQIPRVRKKSSWFSPLPFVSTFSPKRVGQDVLLVVHDLVVQPSFTGINGQGDIHEIFTSMVDICAEYKLSLSNILQELSVAEHTPMYWAIVNYREELLVALLVHAQPLTVQTISDIRRACLVSSNQALFHSLRGCRPPFQDTQGLQVASVKATPDSLLMGNQSLDEVHVEESSDEGFVVSIEIPLWQMRMKAIGQVSVEFITAGRMWAVIFFCTDPSSPATASGKRRRGTNTWHVMVSLLESSSPTFFDSQMVIDVPPPKTFGEMRSAALPALREEGQPGRFAMNVGPPVRSKGRHNRAKLRKTHSSSSVGSVLSPTELRLSTMALPALLEEGRPGRSSMSDLEPPARLEGYNRSKLRKTHSSTSLGSLPSPTEPRLRSTTCDPPIIIRLGSGKRKLGCRLKPGEFPKTPMTKPDTWSDLGERYTSAVVSPLEEYAMSRLLHDRSPYFYADGTLRVRLKARFVKVTTSRGCVIC